ncbi:hypothetical protein [Flavobacterium lindanitolerans]|jgi:hypothetical protein|uniref:hypothetical protein n=1 Tax=Flavobacterium lindanitolerans TaxID=428988 RepID=UPI0023F5250D|nr:hypothetical protein [Flavobacterium lindanitolerans]
MTEEQAKEIIGRLDEISETLISLETFFVESGFKGNLSKIADSLKQIVENNNAVN